MTATTDSLVSLDAIRAAADRIAWRRGQNAARPRILPRSSRPGLAQSRKPPAHRQLQAAWRGQQNPSAPKDEIARGVITYSSGNHAQGVAYAAREVGAKAVIVMPSNAPAIKRAATLALGAQVVDVGVASSERLAKAEELVREHGYVVIPPYDDEQIIAGQATCGLEIIEAIPEVDLVLAPVSGGGLLSGIAAAVKRISPRTRVFGIEPELAADATESYRTGKLTTWTAELTSRTIADGLRTQSVGVRNFAHIQAFVDGIITVTEAEIRAAMRAIVASARLVPEPSGAVTSAALLFHRAELPAFKTAVAVVSGGNVDPALLAEVLTEVGHLTSFEL